MMCPSADPNKKPNSCCKNEDNVEFCYGDSIEWEVYKCKKCKTYLSVPCQIQRFHEDSEVLLDQED